MADPAAKTAKASSSIHNPLSIQTLAAELRTLGEPTFRNRYPHGFLLVKSVPPSSESGDMGPKTIFTMLISGEGKGKGLKVAEREGIRGALPREALPLVKTVRNVYERKITVGRAKNNDIVIRSPKISKVHAVIERQKEGDYFLSDLGSTNGTRVNGERLNRKQTVKLASGDEIKFCRHEFEFLDLEVFIEVLKKFY
jgi:hypothetical protein